MSCCKIIWEISTCKLKLWAFERYAWFPERLRMSKVTQPFPDWGQTYRIEELYIYFAEFSTRRCVLIHAQPIQEHWTRNNKHSPALQKYVFFIFWFNFSIFVLFLTISRKSANFPNRRRSWWANSRQPGRRLRIVNKSGDERVIAVAHVSRFFFSMHYKSLSTRHCRHFIVTWCVMDDDVIYLVHDNLMYLLHCSDVSQVAYVAEPAQELEYGSILLRASIWYIFPLHLKSLLA